MLVLAGYLLIHLVEHTVVRHFHFGEETHPEHVGVGVGVSALIGLSIHSFFDGISIASGFVISPAARLAALRRDHSSQGAGGIHDRVDHARRRVLARDGPAVVHRGGRRRHPRRGCDVSTAARSSAKGSRSRQA